MRDRLTHALALGQGLYFFTTGVWPLFSMRTFEAVTGPKVDRWLVKTVGVLVGVIGAVLTMAGARRRVEPEIAVLAAGSAAGLAAVDTVYATKGRISKIYLLDAVVEVALIAAWALAASQVSRAGAASRRSTRPARRGAGTA
ncbi:MAG: hypothetical protein FJ027_13335 [Candidatus Rokubacteria bacterium]|nr:hypothetical protein [Candidatus Rokubacteria bacterium]